MPGSVPAILLRPATVRNVRIVSFVTCSACNNMHRDPTCTEMNASRSAGILVCAHVRVGRIEAQVTPMHGCHGAKNRRYIAHVSSADPSPARASWHIICSYPALHDWQASDVMQEGEVVKNTWATYPSVVQTQNISRFGVHRRKTLLTCLHLQPECCLVLIEDHLTSC
jgi:hypothetical protein